MSRANDALVERRIDDILRIRLDGAQFWDVREFVREKEKEEGSAWFLAEGEESLSDGQLRRYQQQADTRLRNEYERNHEKLFHEHIAKRRNLFARAVTSGDIGNAAKILKDEAELLGLYPPKKVAPTDPTGKKEYAGGMSDAERLAALAALRTRLGTASGGTDTPGEGRANGQILGSPISPDE